MNLSVSNIGWAKEEDPAVYAFMGEHGFHGLEIAPTRIFPEAPYAHPEEAGLWAKKLLEEWNFTVPSMQSIWYGRQEKIFGTREERAALLEYTRKAIDFAEAIGCGNLVFGCPRNRNLEDASKAELAVPFFRELGEYARQHHTVIGMEANPPIYNTNYINGTDQALKLIEEVNSEGFRLNLDLGTMIYNEEAVELLEGHGDFINHVHISEPYLKPIEKRKLHWQILELLKKMDYRGFVSIEMGKTEDLRQLQHAIQYVSELI